MKWFFFLFATTQINDYDAFATSMAKELYSIVGDAKMKGSQHEALHSWLQHVFMN
jgi:hypothetical protein